MEALGERMQLSYCRRLLSVTCLALTLAAGIAYVAQAQQFTNNTDPKPILGQLISAFQYCGPPQVYQYLGIQLYQTIAFQTNNTGCYANIAAAGPIASMQVINVNQLPAGPVFAVRVRHQSGIVADWYIGLSNYTGRVEYLTFVGASAGSALPDANVGPVNAQGTDISEIAQPNVTPVNQSSDCKLYKTMCK